MSGALDWFVSYTGADERWAEWIAWQLEAKGFSTKLQKWDFRAGMNFVLAMQEAASKAERTLAVLSPAYLESGFGGAEWAAAFVQDPTGQDAKLLPVRVADFKPPGLLRAIVFVDLFGKSEADARAALLAGVERQRAKPDTEPAFPGGAAPRSTGGESNAPAFPGALPHVFTVPFRRNPYFAGRDDTLAALRTAFAKGHAAAVTQPQAIHGLGGVGKTQLAVEYAWAHSGDYDAVLWAVADSPENLRANLAALAGPAALDLPEREAREEAVQVAAVLRWLKTHRRWLLVLDSADSQPAARAALELVPAATAGHLLITSRRTDWPLSVKDLPVDVLSEAVATQFLLERAKLAGGLPGSAEEARAVARELGCLPLALEQAAAYVERKHLGFRDYLAHFKAALPKVLEYAAEGATGYHRTVFSTWLVTETELSREARAVLQLTSFLAPEDIPRDLFARGGEAFRAALARIEGGGAGASAPTDLAEAAERGLVDLADYSLVTLGPAAFSCHRLVMTVQRERLSPEEQRTWLTLALGILDAAAPPRPEDVRTWPLWDPLRTHVAEAVLAADRAGITEPTARLMNQLGTFLRTKAQWVEAEPLHRRALAIDEKSYGPDHPEVATCLNNLAGLLQATNRMNEAEPLHRRALAIDEKSYGPDHPEVATCLNNLAGLLQATNRMNEAEPLYRRALAVDEKSYGPDHPEVATCLNNLAELLRATNRMNEAEPLYRRALAIDEKSYGPDHPTVAIRLNNLAGLLRATNRMNEAEPLFRRALAIDEKSYGSDHPTVATRLNNLAELLRATNRLNEAEPIYRRALAIDEKSYGPDHPTVATRLNNLAGLLRATNRLNEAEPIYRRALAITEKSYGPDHPDVATCLNNLALLLRATNRLNEAEPIYRRALAITEKSYGPDHPDVATCLNNLALLLRATNRLNEAEPMSRRCLVILLKFTTRTGHEHPHLGAGAANYEGALRARGLSDTEVAARLEAAKDEAARGVSG